MLNATHSKWLPVSKSNLTANQGQNPQTTTTTRPSQVKVLPTTTTYQDQQHNNSNHQSQQSTRTKKYIQLNAPRSGRTIVVARQRQPQPLQQRPFFLRNYEILSQESLEQLLEQQNALLNQTQLLKRNQLNQRTSTSTQTTIPRERIIQIPISQLEEDDQEITTEATPVYTIISVPFLARSFLPTSSVQQRKLKTNGSVKTKQSVVNVNGKEELKRFRVYQEQENTSAHLNLLNKRNQQLNTTTVQNLNTTATTTQTSAVKSSNTTSINLNTTKTPITTTSSAEMMGIQPGNEFQDLSGILQTAAVEELMAPVCLDDYFIETNNTSDFDANKGTYKLNGLNEMTINQSNVDFAEQQQQQQHQLQLENEKEQLMKEVLGEEELFNILRMQNSEELVTLTQPSLEHETLNTESYFTTHIDTTDLITNSEDSENSSSYIAISPGSPLPTESDCISTAELHNHKYMDTSSETIMQDEETSYRIEFSPESLDEHSPLYFSGNHMRDEEEGAIYEQLLRMSNIIPSLQQTQSLKRNSDHLSIPQKTVSAKKFKHVTPMLQINGHNEYGSKVPDTPGICDMVDEWFKENYDASINSYSSSHSPSGESFAPSDLIAEQFSISEPKFENPPSVASSYICEEPSLYATPSPSNSSSYSTNPNSPAVSVYGNGSSKKPRGRPPKQHSDLPDPKVWQKLPESERKRYEDRCKNNEASRQSRRKNKEKLMDMVAKEEHEQSNNDKLKKKLRILEKQKYKLEKALYEIFKNSNS